MRTTSGEDHGQRHRLEQFSFDPFEGEDRQVHDDDDQFAEHGRLAHFDRRVADDVEARATRLFRVVHPPDRILDHDHRRIDHEAEIEGSK
jgi:hypothetical protein